MNTRSLQHQVAAVRRFNRFYTGILGMLDEGLLGSAYSLTEVRVLYELGQDQEQTAATLCQRLKLDAGYLSRMIRRLDDDELLERSTSHHDARRKFLKLTPAGKKLLDELQELSNQAVTHLLQPLDDEHRLQLTHSMQRVEQLLHKAAGTESTFQALILIRPHQPGDMGWVVWRHGMYYAREFGWNEEFEALVARLTADFIQQFKPNWERCWIAEQDGHNVGCIFLTQDDPITARLRMLYLEPSVRGAGLGKRLVTECVETARKLGYWQMRLWTNARLDAARNLYQQQGFRKVGEETSLSFGKMETHEHWELKFG